MSANFMGGPRVALARIRDSRKQKLQQNALAQGATGATTAAAGASTRRADDAKGAEDDGLANGSKEKRQSSQSGRDTTSNSKKRRKEEADDASRGRSIDTTANERDLQAEEGGSRRGSVKRASADDDEGKVKDEQHDTARDTSPDLEEKRRLLLDHDDWLGAGEIEGILRKKRKKGESRTGRREKKKDAATSAPGGGHGQELSGRTQREGGRSDVAGLDSGEVRCNKGSSKEQAHQVATSSRSDDQDAGKSFSTLQPRASPTKLQQHFHAIEPLLPTKALPALSLHPEALYTNSIKGLFTSGALGKGDAKAGTAEARSTTKSSAGIPYFGDEDASKGGTNAAKPTLEAPQSIGGEVAEAGTDGELGELETMLFRQREDTRRRLFRGH